MLNGNDPTYSEKHIAKENYENLPGITTNGKTASAPPQAPPGYFESQLTHQQAGINNFQHANNPNFQINLPQPPCPMEMNNNQFKQLRAPYPIKTNNYQYNQSQTPYSMGMNSFQFNQPETSYLVEANNTQFNQSQVLYPIGMINSQFNHPQHQLHNPQLPSNTNNTQISQPQTSNIINVNVNQPTKENTVFVQHPQNHMGLAIFSCLCCFCPVGICAIFKAYEVDSAFAVGQFTRAQNASNAARTLARIAILVGCLIICGFISAMIVAVVKFK
ncbi:uncharacterized protein LOC124813859 [Hydra vulgaris]|uniref:uncharacterized protein LOC124813859 n=1 Tax=Hydra vulgaris TaxID=6087 RepID=UPI001F5ECBD8|nr:uncharacterized protein LOC124813859 [Hydra vulgaris]